MLEKLFADDFHQHPLSAPSVELPVEDLLPGAEIQLALGDGVHGFTSHDLPLHMGVGVVFAHIVPVG